MAENKLIIHPKPPKGEDGYCTFSIRIKKDIAAQLGEISTKCGYSRNKLIAKFLEYALEHCEISEI